MFQSSFNSTKSKNLEIRQNHHYYLNAPYQGMKLDDLSKHDVSQDSSGFHKNNSYNKYTQETDHLTLNKQSVLVKDIRSISNQSQQNTHQLNDITKSFIFRIKSKNHIQNDPIVLEDIQKDKEKKTKDLVKVLHEMKKKRQEFTQRGQFIPQSPIPLLKRQNDISLDGQNTERQEKKLKKLPRILKKIQQNIATETQDQVQPLTRTSKLQGNGIGEDPFQQKLQRYYQFLFIYQCNHLFFVKQSQVRAQAYFIEDDGENENIIKQLIKKRWWWSESTDKNDEINLYWSQKSNLSYMQKQRIRVLFDKSQSRIVDPFNFENYEEQLKFAIEHKLTLITPYGKLHNHIEINQLIGYKKNFFKLISAYFLYINEDLNQYFPYTTIVTNLQDPKFNIFSIKYKLTNTLWLVKPGEWVNNGPFMKLCQNSKQVQDFIQSELKSKDRNYETFIIQQYIKPLLYYKRKFDLYTYLLISQINGVVRVYFYDNVYGRTSSKEYSENDLDPVIHFTNSQVQKESKQFSLYEPGNKLFQDKLQEFFIQFKINFKEQMIPQLINLAKYAFQSVFTNLVIKDHNFEIIGLNFILDTSFKPWLVELNLNPSFIPDCHQHERLLTSMLDNVLNLTIDLIYPPPSLWPNNKRQLIDQFTQKNKFEIIFDSRFDSEKLLDLYQKSQI